MKYLIDSKTHRINQEAWYDEEDRVWLEPGVVCWNPEQLCKEGEEKENGYIVVDIPEEEIYLLLDEREEDLYYIKGKVTTKRR